MSVPKGKANAQHGVDRLRDNFGRSAVGKGLTLEGDEREGVMPRESGASSIQELYV